MVVLSSGKGKLMEEQLRARLSPNVAGEPETTYMPFPYPIPQEASARTASPLPKGTRTRFHLGRWLGMLCVVPSVTADQSRAKLSWEKVGWTVPERLAWAERAIAFSVSISRNILNCSEHIEKTHTSLKKMNQLLNQSLRSQTMKVRTWSLQKSDTKRKRRETTSIVAGRSNCRLLALELAFSHISR